MRAWIGVCAALLAGPAASQGIEERALIKEMGVAAYTLGMCSDFYSQDAFDRILTTWYPPSRSDRQASAQSEVRSLLLDAYAQGRLDDTRRSMSRDLCQDLIDESAENIGAVTRRLNSIAAEEAP